MTWINMFELLPLVLFDGSRAVGEDDQRFVSLLVRLGGICSEPRTETRAWTTMPTTNKRPPMDTSVSWFVPAERERVWILGPASCTAGWEATSPRGLCQARSSSLGSSYLTAVLKGEMWTRNSNIIQRSPLLLFLLVWVASQGVEQKNKISQRTNSHEPFIFMFYRFWSFLDLYKTFHRVWPEPLHVTVQGYSHSRLNINGHFNYVHTVALDTANRGRIVSVSHTAGRATTCGFVLEPLATPAMFPFFSRFGLFYYRQIRCQKKW